MRVKLLSTLNHDGKNLPADSIIDVSEDLGEKWVTIGAAELADEGAANAAAPLVGVAPATPEQTLHAVAPQPVTPPAAPSGPAPQMPAPQPPISQPTPEQIEAELRAAGLDNSGNPLA